MIYQSYLVEEEYKIAPFTFTKTRFTLKKYLPGKYDINKQRRAVRPNLIHSLDATTIAMLYNYLDGISIYMIHDCFAVTAKHVPLLIYKLKMVYIRLYSSHKYLIDFDNIVRLSINKTYGDQVFKVNGKYVNMPDTNKPILYPDVNDIINIYSEDTIDRLKYSSYLAV